MEDYKLQMEHVFAIAQTMEEYDEHEREDIRNILKYNMKILISLRDELNKNESYGQTPIIKTLRKK
jgi:hypothetical protein